MVLADVIALASYDSGESEGEEEVAEELFEEEVFEDDAPAAAKAAWKSARLKQIDTRNVLDEAYVRSRAKREAADRAAAEEDFSRELYDPDAYAASQEETRRAAAHKQRMIELELERRYRLRFHARVREQLELWWRAAQVSFAEARTGRPAWALSEAQSVLAPRTLLLSSSWLR